MLTVTCLKIKNTRLERAKLDKKKIKYKECTESTSISMWTKTFIEELFEIQTGATPNRSTPEYWLNAKIPWLKSGEVNNSDINSSQEFISEIALSETNAKLYPVNSILIAMYEKGKPEDRLGY